ncbi:D-serine ammonia-lyase [Desulfovibrio sp. JY]|nr:D-serine ammonia-lyase [Desulfovibrio sp. JY]
METVMEAALRAGKPVFWQNPLRRPVDELRGELSGVLADIRAAAARFSRFAPLLADLFPELRPTGGVIESQLLPLPEAIGAGGGREPVFLKADHLLPVAGSVKARGGFHAVLAVAERLALTSGLLAGPDADSRLLGEGRSRAFFAGHTLSVGSTGNLGLSIGILGRALGFAVTVHMSGDARPWKKEKLREAGATVVEHAGDYAAACATARAAAAGDPTNHFIDDENSRDLFLGYAVAGLRLPAQLRPLGIVVSPQRPLCLHLPCGVGGAPGGIALGARLALGDGALAIFVEPAEAPCMLLGLATGRHEAVSVKDMGLSGRTIADGLAVPRPSGLVCRLVAPVVDGVCTVTDAAMAGHVVAAWKRAGLRLEPSAAAALAGPAMTRAAGLPRLAGKTASHIVWATGGGMLPDEVFEEILAMGEGQG